MDGMDGVVRWCCALVLSSQRESLKFGGDNYPGQGRKVDDQRSRIRCLCGPGWANEGSGRVRCQPGGRRAWWVLVFIL